LLGAIYLLLIDNIARIMAQVEIPIGILTSLLGIPVLQGFSATPGKAGADGADPG